MPSKFSGLFAVLATALVGWAAVACAPATESTDSLEEIRIGLLVADQEPLLDTSRFARAGAELAVEHARRGGGLEIGGVPHRVVLVVEPTAGTEEGGLSAALKLITQERVDALVGPLSSSAAIPAAAAAERAGIPMITPTASSREITRGKRFVFRVNSHTDDQARAMARFAREDLDARRAALLYDVANAYNRSFADAFKAAFVQRGGQVVADETYTTGEVDFRASVLRIRDAVPDVVYLPNYGSAVLVQARLIRELGIPATLLGGDAWRAIAAEEALILEGSFFTHHWHVDLAGEPARAFAENFRRARGEEPHPAAAMAYEAFGVLFRALETAGSLEGERIRDALARLENYQGVTGRISYPGRGDPIRNLVILRIHQGDSLLHKEVSAAVR